MQRILHCGCAHDSGVMSISLMRPHEPLQIRGALLGGGGSIDARHGPRPAAFELPTGPR